MEVTYKVKCDLNKNLLIPDLEMVQGDNCTRVIEVSLYADDVEWNIPSGCTAAVGFGKPSGNNGLYDQLPDGTAAVTITENVIRAVLTKEVLTEAGRVKLLIVLNDEDLNQLATFPLNLRVARNPAAGEIVSNSYYKYTTMDAVSKAVDAWLTETAEKQDAFLETGAEALAEIKSVVNDGEDAPPIICAANGEVIAVSDASDRLLRGLHLYGKTIQNGTPTPDAPVELESVGADGNVAVTVCGKNLLSNRATDYAGMTEEVFDGRNCLSWIDGETHFKYESGFAENTPYTITLTVYCPSQTTDAYVYIVYKDGTKESLAFNYGWSTKTHTTNPDKTFISLKGSWYDGKKNLIDLDSSQIELGSTATSYEPYKESQALTAKTPNGLPGIPVSSGGNYTDENGQQWICDEIDFARGKYVQRVKKLNAPNAIGGYANSQGIIIGYVATDAISKPSNFLGGVLCNKLPNTTADTQYIKNIDCITLGNSRVAITVADITTFEAFAQWVKDNALDIVYALATPIETDLTAEELAAFSALHTNYPNTTIYNDEGAGMAVEYVADTKLYIDNKFAELASAIVNN